MDGIVDGIVADIVAGIVDGIVDEFVFWIVRSCGWVNLRGCLSTGWMELGVVCQLVRATPVG